MAFVLFCCSALNAQEGGSGEVRDFQREEIEKMLEKYFDPYLVERQQERILLLIQLVQTYNDEVVELRKENEDLRNKIRQMEGGKKQGKVSPSEAQETVQ